MANLPFVNANSDKVLGIMKMYSRMGAYPLDATSVFETKADLEAYINEAGSYAYAGQVVAVANGTIAETNGAKYYTLYVIRSDKSVQEVGKNLIFETTEAAQAYATANPDAFHPGEIFTVKNDTKYDLYTFKVDGGVQKLSFDASTDLPDMEWDSILNKPVSTTAQIDAAVKYIEDNLAENADDGHLQYKTKDVAFVEDLTWSKVADKPETFTPSAHTHAKEEITSVSASVIEGVISIDNLPSGALERCVVVADDEARFALTEADVQLGDTVKVTETGIMYFVKDASKLAEDAGYEVYTAGSATNVPWSGVQNKPTAIKDYASDAVDTADVQSGDAIEAGKIVKANAAGKVEGSITGDAATVGGRAADSFANAQHTHETSEITGLDTEIANLKNGSSITAFDATKLTGTISENNLPAGALMGTTTVASESALQALTSAEVLNGDIVYVTGGNMYLVLDNTKMAEGEGVGYTIFRGEGSSVEYTDVLNKPTAIKDFASDAVDTSDVQSGSAIEAGKIVKANADGKVQGSITGDAATVGGKAPEAFAEAVHTHTEDDITGNISWGKLTGTPTTLGGYGITDGVNSSEVVTVAEPNKLLKLDGDSKLPASITGDADTVDGKHASDFAAAVHEHAITDVTGLEAELTNIKNGNSITNVNAGVITGVLSLENIPHGAMEQCKVVANDEARFALTTNEVQKGDTVKVTSTGKMYFIVDDTKLAEEAGYEVYTAGSATEVPWSGVTGKPTTIEGYGITDAYTMDGADAKFVAQTEVVDVATANKILKLDASGKLPASITGEAGSVAWANVTGKPNSSVEAIDQAVELAAHANREVLDGLTENTDGRLLHDTKEVAYLTDISAFVVVSDTQPVDQPVGGLWFDTSASANA